MTAFEQNRDVDARLMDYALGVMAPDARATLEAQAREDADLARRLSEHVELLAGLDAAAPAADASLALRDDVLASLLPPGDASRFRGFAPRLAKLFDVSSEEVETEHLPKLASPREAPWEPLPYLGCMRLRVCPGPTLAHASAMYVFVPNGSNIPWHEHSGEERLLVIDGYAHEVLHRAGGHSGFSRDGGQSSPAKVAPVPASGPAAPGIATVVAPAAGSGPHQDVTPTSRQDLRSLAPGDLVVSAAGTGHEVRFEPGMDCLFAVVMQRAAR